jgi:ribosomal protein S18 acetylase RimI-like enzyme
MEIRKAIPADVPVIVEFQQAMALETEALKLDENTLNRGVANVFKDPSKGFYLVARHRERVVASMLLTPEWSDWRSSLFLWIQSLYVIPEYRRKGIFRMMYEHVMQLVQGSEDYAGIKLYVDKDNLPAQAVYRRVGMKDSHYNLFEWNKMEY